MGPGTGARVAEQVAADLGRSVAAEETTLLQAA
jgi:hypothetical protein